MKYMYEDFEDYLKYAPFDKNHPNIEAFKIIWDMARTKLVEPIIKGNPDIHYDEYWFQNNE